MHELEDERTVDILLGHCSNPDVAHSGVEESGTGDAVHRRLHLLAGMDYVHSECIYGTASTTKQSNLGFLQKAL